MSVPRGCLIRAATFLALGFAPAPAATIHVPEDRPSLTAAVAAAKAGDEIRLGPGRFSPTATRELFPIRLAGLNLRIRGAGVDRTILDAEGHGRLFIIESADRSRLSDLRLMGGQVPDGGGALRIEGGEPELQRVAVAGSISPVDGDGVLVLGGRPRLANCIFTGNGGRGPTVCVAGGSPTFLRCTFWENGGPALEIRGAAAPRVERCVVGRPGSPSGAAYGLRVLATKELSRPRLVANLFLECEGGVVRVEGEAGRELADALETSRRERGLRSRAGTLKDPERGDFRLRVDGALDADFGAYGGEAALPAPPELAEPRRGAAADDSTTLLGPSTPNPFAPPTTIRFHVPEPSFVDLGIYNVLGQRVRSLPAGDLGEGDHRREWNGRDDHGEDLPPGIYFVRITIGALTESHRLVLVR